MVHVQLVLKRRSVVQRQRRRAGVVRLHMSRSATTSALAPEDFRLVPVNEPTETVTRDRRRERLLV